MAESRVECVDRACAEFEAFCAGSLFDVRERVEVEGGEVLICGSADLERWNAVFVHASDRAVVPLAAGEGVEVMAATMQLGRSGAALSDRKAFRPPLAIVGGSRCVFEAACGANLLGVVRHGGRAVLLVARGRAVAVVHVEGKTRRVLKVGLPGQLGEVDVDGLLAATRRTRAGRSEPEARVLRVEARTRAHHLRIVGGAAVEFGEGPPWEAVVGGLFDGVEALASVVMDPKLRRAVWLLPRVLGCLKVMVVEGYDTIEALVHGLRALIRRRFPDFEVSLRDLASVLRLVEATGLGLVRRSPSRRGTPGRIWEVRLGEVGDPRSALHQAICAAIRGRSLGSAAGALAREGQGRKSQGRKGQGREGEGRKSRRRASGGAAVADAPTRDEAPPSAQGGSDAHLVATLASAVCAAIVGVAESGRAAAGRIAALEAERDAAVAERDAAVVERDAAVAGRSEAMTLLGVVEAAVKAGARRQCALEGEIAALREELGRASEELVAVPRRAEEAEAERVTESTARQQEGETSVLSSGEVAMLGGLAVGEGKSRQHALPCFVEAALRSMMPALGRGAPRAKRPRARWSGKRSSRSGGVTSRRRCTLGTLGARGPPR